MIAERGLIGLALAGRVARWIRTWPARRVGLAAVAGGLVLWAAVLGQVAPLQAQEEANSEADGAPRNVAGVRISGLSGSLTSGSSDSFTVEAFNLTTVVGYEVSVSRNNGTLGIGACGTSSQTQRVSGVKSQNLTFTVHGCAAGAGTVTAVVRRSGLTTNEDAVSQGVTVTARAPDAPARPTAPNPQPRAFTAQWQAPGNTGGAALTGYHVLRRANGAAWPPDSQAKKVGATTRSYRFTGLAPNRIYWFKVKACNGANQTRCSGWSPQASVTLPIDKPGTPRWGALTEDITQIQVRWSAPEDTGGVSLTGYGLRHWRPGTDREPSGAQAVVNAQTHDRTFSGLAPDTTYRFSIQACNGTNRCSGWSNKDGRTDPTPSPTPTPEPVPPDPTEPPEPPEPPKPPPVERPGSGIADQMYLAGQLVSVLLPAASGGGHWTYTLTPALTNGLTFDPSSRTIAGTPQVGANAVEHTYTATKTENGATTIETSQFSVAVFDLAIWAERLNDGNAQRLQGATFWGGVYERWKVLEYALIWTVDVLPGGASRVGDYWFQLRLPASAGFQANLTGGCDWPNKAPSDTEQVQTAWTPSSFGFYFVRCSLGSASSANVELWVRDKGGTEALLQTRALSGQAWHQADHVATYYVRGTSGATIRLVESAVDAGDGLFPKPRPANLDPTVTPGPTYTPNPVLGNLHRYVEAAGTWTALDGVKVQTAASRAEADAVIKGYWDTDPAGEDDGVCMDSIACVYVGGVYPDLKLEMEFFIEDPPHWGSDDYARAWTLDHQLARRRESEFQYLPAVLVHELGHVLGLGHSNDPYDIMNGFVREIGCTRSDCGLSDNDREGARALYTSPHHAPH